MCIHFQKSGGLLAIVLCALVLPPWGVAQDKQFLEVVNNSDVVAKVKTSERAEKALGTVGTGGVAWRFLDALRPGRVRLFVEDVDGNGRYTDYFPVNDYGNRSYLIGKRLTISKGESGLNFKVTPVSLLEGKWRVFRNGRFVLLINVKHSPPQQPSFSAVFTPANPTGSELSNTSNAYGGKLDSGDKMTLARKKRNRVEVFNLSWEKGSFTKLSGSLVVIAPDIRFDDKLAKTTFEFTLSADPEYRKLTIDSLRLKSSQPVSGQ
jgi:hypothetical protein